MWAWAPGGAPAPVQRLWGLERDGDSWMISSAPLCPIALGGMSVVLGIPPPESVHMAPSRPDWPCHRSHVGRDGSQERRRR